MDDETIIDVSSFEFEPWVKFVFDRPVKKYPDESWYWNSGDKFVVINPRRLLEHLTQLCHRFSEITSPYTAEQINQGIWFLLSEPIRAGEYLADASIPTAVKINCISSMFHVYDGFVAKTQTAVMENCFDMWWDLVCKSFWHKLEFHNMDAQKMLEVQSLEELRSLAPPANYEQLASDEKLLVDAMLDALIKILQLKDSRCEAYALHGLGHLRHPSVKTVVQNFIDVNKETISEDGLAWIESCRDGNVM